MALVRFFFALARALALKMLSPLTLKRSKSVGTLFRNLEDDSNNFVPTRSAFA